MYLDNVLLIMKYYIIFPQKFEALIKDGAPMEAKNTHGLTALQVVCNNQDVEMVTTLLRAGCQVNAKSSVTGINLFFIQ